MEAITWLESLQKFGEDTTLNRIAQLLDAAHHPEVGQTYIHVTGTNGKGSTAACLASILNASDYRVGLFTSPHLHSYTERMQINDTVISEADFAQLAEQMHDILEALPALKPALFDVLTIMALLYFKAQNVDVAILEVGLGGRHDSTNCVDSIVSLITNVDLEHTEVLGNTTADIAREKAGLICPGSTAITSETDPAIREIFAQEAEAQSAEFRTVELSDIVPRQQAMTHQQFSYKHYQKLDLPLIGRHQLRNASLAIEAAVALQERGWQQITDTSITAGLKDVRWPLRLEVVHEKPTIIIDVGHNPHGIQSIIETVNAIDRRAHTILILGCSFDKPYENMAKQLASLADTIILTKATYHGVEITKLDAAIQPTQADVHHAQTVAEAVKKAKELANDDDIIMVFGGLYLGAEAKEAIDAS